MPDARRVGQRTRPTRPEPSTGTARRARNWVVPESYTHVATAAVRRLDVVFVAEEVAAYDALSAEVLRDGLTLSDVVRSYVRSGRKPGK